MVHAVTTNADIFLKFSRRVQAVGIILIFQKEGIIQYYCTEGRQEGGNGPSSHYTVFLIFQKEGRNEGIDQPSSYF